MDDEKLQLNSKMTQLFALFGTLKMSVSLKTTLDAIRCTTELIDTIAIQKRNTNSYMRNIQKLLIKERRQMKKEYIQDLRANRGFKMNRLLAAIMTEAEKGNKADWLENWYLYEMSLFFKQNEKVQWSLMQKYLQENKVYKPEGWPKSISNDTLRKRVENFESLLVRYNLQNASMIRD